MRFGEAMRAAQGTDWIRPRYAQYLKGKRKVVQEQIHMNRLLAIPERDRTKSWAASGAGKCLRQRQFSFLGVKGKGPDDHALNIFLNGTWVHLRHQTVGLAAGYLADAEIPVFKPELNLVGTMDAIDATGTPVEYKSINQNGFMQVRQFGARHDHVEQMHSYMLAGDFEGFRAVYENKNTNDLLEFYVHRDEELIGKVYRELDSLNKATAAHTLLPMLEECKRKTGAYRWCPFASQCPTANFQEIQETSLTPVTSSSGSD